MFFILMTFNININIKAMYVTNSQILSHPKPFTVNEFIQDQYMLEYLDNLFESVRIHTNNNNVNKNVNRKNNNNYHNTKCYCNGCYIENECLVFLRQHICEKIKGFYCDDI